MSGWLPWSRVDMAGSRSSHRSAAAVLGGDLMLAPMVVMMRLPLMAMEGASMAPASETWRAVAEKHAALVEGMVAAQMSIATSMMRFWPDVMAGRTPSMLSGDAMERSLQAALRPAGKTVRANFRRLSRQR